MFKKIGKNLDKSLIFLYVFIFLTWLLALVYKYINPEQVRDSVVLASLFGSEVINGLNPIESATLDFYDAIIKINLFIFDWGFGLVFLFLLILPRLKQKNVLLMMAFIFAGYFLPKIALFYQFYLAEKTHNSFLGSYTTLNDLILWLIFTPLNWSVFLYGYYLIETYILKSED